jgi:hypothetical protein
VGRALGSALRDCRGLQQLSTELGVGRRLSSQDAKAEQPREVMGTGCTCFFFKKKIYWGKVWNTLKVSTHVVSKYRSYIHRAIGMKEAHPM